MKAQNELLVYGYTRKQFKSNIPNGIKSIFSDYYHIPLVFDDKDFGQESSFKKLNAKTIEKIQNDNNYTFLFMDGIYYYGCIQCKLRVLSLDNCCDVNIGIIKENEYNSKYITHSQQIEKMKTNYDYQTPYNVDASYNGYTGCLFLATMENGILSESPNASYGVNDIVTLKLDFRKFQLMYYKNDELIHKTDITPNTRYKIFVNTFSKDIIEML